MAEFYVYMTASRRKGTLYVGVTNNLARRMYEHKEKLNKGFTSKYDVTKLVWYEVYQTPEDAIHREKRLKEWQRQWKIDLIEKMNPDWADLYEILNQ